MAAASGSFSRVGIDGSTPAGYEVVKEGFAAVLFPPAAHKKTKASSAAGDAAEDDDQAVFYNPAQVVNRDLSVCAISTFSRLRHKEPRRAGGLAEGEGITILEALSASGLRAIRYWNEIPDVRFIIANDLDPDAVECIQRNASHNGVPLVHATMTENCPAGMKGVIANEDDAVVLMQRLAHGKAPQRLCAAVPSTVIPLAPAATGDATPQPTMLRALLQQEKMDVVDLDPYGSASPFLDAAFSCAKEGALFLVTSTDSAILCGNYPDTCHAKYSSIGIKGDACHEVAVRILLAAAERAANKHSKYIVPLLSLHIDFYVRCFFRVYTQPAEVKLSVCKLGHLFQCQQCPNFVVSPVGFGRPTRTKTQKRERSGKAAGNDEQVDQQQQPDTAEEVAASVSYPSAPSRQQPFKVSSNRVPASVVGDGGCRVCGGHFVIAGPIYAAPTQNRPFLAELMQTIDDRATKSLITAVDRVRGLVRAAIDEMPDTPLFYSLPGVASLVRSRCPPSPVIVGALARLGYKFSQVHCDKSGLKVDCPYEVLVGIFLAYKQKEQQEAALEQEQQQEADGLTSTNIQGDRRPGDTAPTATRLRCPAIPGAVFDYDKQFDFRSSATGITKFIPNAPGWGPKRRHQGVLRHDDAEENK